MVLHIQVFFANGAILSPFNHDQKLIADTESCEYFISQVLESTAFQNVVQWTLDYAPKSTKRSAETVKKRIQKVDAGVLSGSSFQ